MPTFKNSEGELPLHYTISILELFCQTTDVWSSTFFQFRTSGSYRNGSFRKKSHQREKLEFRSKMTTLKNSEGEFSLYFPSCSLELPCQETDVRSLTFFQFRISGLFRKKSLQRVELQLHSDTPTLLNQDGRFFISQSAAVTITTFEIFCQTDVRSFTFSRMSRLESLRKVTPGKKKNLVLPKNADSKKIPKGSSPFSLQSLSLSFLPNKRCFAKKRMFPH